MWWILILGLVVGCSAGGRDAQSLEQSDGSGDAGAGSLGAQGGNGTGGAAGAAAQGVGGRDKTPPEDGLANGLGRACELGDAGTWCEPFTEQCGELYSEFVYFYGPGGNTTGRLPVTLVAAPGTDARSGAAAMVCSFACTPDEGAALAADMEAAHDRCMALDLEDLEACLEQLWFDACREVPKSDVSACLCELAGGTCLSDVCLPAE